MGRDEGTSLPPVDCVILLIPIRLPLDLLRLYLFQLDVSYLQVYSVEISVRQEIKVAVEEKRKVKLQSNPANEWTRKLHLLSLPPSFSLSVFMSVFVSVCLFLCCVFFFVSLLSLDFLYP